MNKLIFPFLFFSILLAGCSKTDVQPDAQNSPPPAQTITYTDPPQFSTPYASVPDTKDVILYEINLRSFSTSGTFAGILNRLDSIKALGVNTIWLMPIYPVGQLKSVGQLGSPYAVRNYKEVNPEFGSLEDLRNLVSKAHAKGMAVILDWVANHTAWDNPWIDNRSWYSQDGVGNIIIPPGTNWQDVADLNYNSNDMRKAMFNAMKYWVITANVDGYRCDYADGVPYDFWKAAIDTLKTIPGHKLIMLAEGSRSDHFVAGFQMNYAWDFFSTLSHVFKNNLTATALATTNTSEQSGLPTGSFKLRFTSNHDEDAWNDTPLGLFGGKDGSLSAFVLASYMGGVPLLYNGQEVGCSVKLPFFSRSPINWTTNPDMTATYKKLIAFRKSSEAVKRGTIESYSHADIAVFKRTYNTEEVLVLVNTRNNILNYTLDAAVANTSWTNIQDNSMVNLSTQVTLQPFGYLILKK